MGGESFGGSPRQPLLTWGSHEFVVDGQDGDDADPAGRGYKTIAAALAVAAIPPATVRINPGYYTESFTVPAGLVVDGPGVSLEGNVVLESGAWLRLLRLDAAAGTIGIVKNDVGGTAYADVGVLFLAGNAIGVLNANVDGVLMYQGRQVYVADGVGLGDIATGDGHLHFEVGDIYITGTGIAVARAAGGSIVGQADHILEEGAGIGNGTALFAAQGEVDIRADVIAATTLANCGAPAVISILCNNLSGAVVAPTQGSVRFGSLPILSGAGAPGALVGYYGQEYVDTTGPALHKQLTWPTGNGWVGPL